MMVISSSSVGLSLCRGLLPKSAYFRLWCYIHSQGVRSISLLTINSSSLSTRSRVFSMTHLSFAFEQGSSQCWWSTRLWTKEFHIVLVH